MTSLFGTSVDAERLRRLGVHEPNHVGTQLVRLESGPGRGAQLLELRAGANLSVQVAVDRGFDIHQATTRGVPIGWTSPSGPRAPMLDGPTGERGWAPLRAFSGLLVTCGLDHFGAPARSDAAALGYPPVAENIHPLHGRIALTPAELAGHGVDWSGDNAIVWCEGHVVQYRLFGEHLILRRRIELPVGAGEIRIVDRVENRAARPARHRLLYHWNFGWPLLDEGATLDLPCEGAALRPTGADPDESWRVQSAPLAQAAERVIEHRLADVEGGEVLCRLANRRLSLAAELRFRRAELPHFLQWQAFEQGIYALGLEPATHGSEATDDADGPLGPGEVRNYRQSLRLQWLDGSQA